MQSLNTLASIEVNLDYAQKTPKERFKHFSVKKKPIHSDPNQVKFLDYNINYAALYNN